MLTRVSGHQIGVPLALSFMARCRPRGEPAFWPGCRGSDCGTRRPIRPSGAPSAINTTAQGGSRGVLRAITLPLRDFDLTYQARVLSDLRAATVWGVALHLDLG